MRAPVLSDDFPSSQLKIFGHSMHLVYDQQKAIIYGGILGMAAQVQATTSELFELNLDTLALRKIKPKAESRKPKPRAFHASALISDYLIILGGKGDSQEFRADLWLFSLCKRDPHPASLSWTQMTILSPSGEHELEFAELVYHTMISLPKNNLLVARFANNVAWSTYFSCWSSEEWIQLDPFTTGP